MLRSPSEWRKFLIEKGYSPTLHIVFDIVESWEKQEAASLETLLNKWKEEERDWHQREEELLAEIQQVERAVYEFFGEVTYNSVLTYVDTLQAIAILRWDHKVWEKHSLRDLCERVQHLTEENERLRGEETPYWKEGEEKPCHSKEKR